MWKYISTTEKILFGLFGLLTIISIVIVFVLIICAIRTPIENKRYILKYNGQVIKCEVEFPRQLDGKVSHWYGTVNLVDCENRKEYFGATNIEVIARPKECSCL